MLSSFGGGSVAKTVASWQGRGGFNPACYSFFESTRASHSDLFWVSSFINEKEQMEAMLSLIDAKNLNNWCFKGFLVPPSSTISSQRDSAYDNF